MDRFMARYRDRWCYLGGGSQTTTQKQETDPQIKALMLGNYAKADDLASTPFQPYTGERVAGFNPTQKLGQSGILGAAFDPTGTNNLNSAVNSVGGILNFAPRTVSAPTISPQSINVGQLKDTNLTPYMNPFQKDVIDATMSQLGQQRGQQAVADNASATAAHAFGGSRQGVQRALTTEAYDRNAGGILAGLNSDNFKQAQTAALQDIGNRLTGDQFNAGSHFAADQFNVGTGMDAAKTNASNDITGAGLRLNAGNAFAQLSDQQLRDALTRAGVISAVGDQQQSLEQQQKDASYEEFLRQINYPVQQQNIRNTAIGLLPSDGTITGTQKKTYGLGDFLMAGISGASKAAAGGAFG